MHFAKILHKRNSFVADDGYGWYFLNTKIKYLSSWANLKKQNKIAFCFTVTDFRDEGTVVNFKPLYFLWVLEEQFAC